MLQFKEEEKQKGSTTAGLPEVQRCVHDVALQGNVQPVRIRVALSIV